MSPYRVASAPYASICAMGLRPVPRLFDMRPPVGACTSEWMTTSLNGTSPMISSPLKIMRFSQRRMMSRAVVLRSPG